MNLINVRPSARKRGNNGFFAADVDRLFNEFFKTDFPNFTGGRAFNAPQPAVNILETGNAFRLELAVPGLEKSDLTLKVEKDTLHISANKEYAKVEGETVKKQEFGIYNFERTFRLAKSIDTESISAKVNNGILSIELPKKEEAKELPARSIEVL